MLLFPGESCGDFTFSSGQSGDTAGGLALSPLLPFLFSFILSFLLSVHLFLSDESPRGKSVVSTHTHTHTHAHTLAQEGILFSIKELYE